MDNQPPAPQPEGTGTPPTQPRKLSGRQLAIISVSLVALIAVAAWGLTATKVKRGSTPPALNHKTAVINITKDGFEPKLATVEPGTTIIWVNKDSNVHHVESNPYPTASEHPDLNSKKALNTEESYSYKVSEPGEYNYHDRMKPESNGRIVVSQ